MRPKDANEMTVYTLKQQSGLGLYDKTVHRQSDPSLHCLVTPILRRTDKAGI